MERKSITNATKVILGLWNIGLFSFVYFNFYVNFAFRMHRTIGGAISLLVYVILYVGFCNMYKAYAFASSKISEIVFSQTISFGLADLILYVETCLIARNYVNVWIGAAIVPFQIAGTIVISTMAKQVLISRIPPKSTLFVYGENVSSRMADIFRRNLLDRYDHMFCIDYIYDETEQNNIEKVFDKVDCVLLYELSYEKRYEMIKKCLASKKIFYFSPGIEDILCQGCEPKHLLDTPLMKYGYQYQYSSKRFGKRLLDFLGALALVIVFSPFMLLTAIAVKLQDGGPVLFRQKRYTKDMKEFNIIKFRSMVVDAEKDGARPCEQNDDRITPVGKFIRASRLDELPQLFNILVGDMSFVGPRPERVEHVEKYSAELPEFKYRLCVKGGLTGYAQIYGKYNTSAYDKLRMDLMYIENQSLFLDLKLIMLTVKTMFEKESTEGFAVEAKSIGDVKMRVNG